MEDELLPLHLEVLEVLHQVKNGKSPGMDEIFWINQCPVVLVHPHFGEKNVWKTDVCVLQSLKKLKNNIKK